MARGFSYAPGASPEVQEALQPDLHRAHIQQLSQSKNWMVRQAIASRTDCPLGVMVVLAHDGHTEVRVTLAANPTISRAVMEHLAQDKHAEVPISLTTNPNVEMDIVEKLAFHKRTEVRTAASARLDAGVKSAHEDDAATPELRERVEPADENRVYDFATGRPISLHAQAAPPAPPAESVPSLAPNPDPAPAPVPTRTAPVRGFRVDQAG